MKFPYLKESASPSSAHPSRNHIYRPRIQIRLRNGERFVILMALIDSGADDCLFPIEVATYLGLKLNPKKTHKYGGIGQGPVTAFFETVMLDIGGWSFPLYAGFSDATTVVPLLGQHGFFDLFQVKFKTSKGIIELDRVD